MVADDIKTFYIVEGEIIDERRFSTVVNGEPSLEELWGSMHILLW